MELSQQGREREGEREEKMKARRGGEDDEVKGSRTTVRTKTKLSE